MIDTNELIQVGQLDGRHEQSNRVYSDNGICPTIMAGQRKTCTGGYISPKIMVRCDNMSKPKLVGGIGDINFGKQFRQGNRVYDANEVGMCLMAQPVGNTGGFSYLYKVNSGGLSMWKNNLEKFNFNMEEVRVADFFSGIGALHKSLTKLGVPVKITNISEIDCDAIISYAAIHIENFKDLEFEYPSVEEMREFLIKRNIGYSYEKNKSSIPRMKVEKLKLVYKASIMLNNLGDISKIDYKDIEDFDLMNLSFSCTDLSGAGKQKGMKNEDGTPTRSGLYIYGIKAIREKKPKYIMIENVKGLIQKKFIDDFYSIVDELEDIGYNCYYPTKEDKKGNKTPICLNSKDFGIPQNRQRIFVVCVRKDVDDSKFEFPIGRDLGIRLKDLLEDEVAEKYYLSEEYHSRFVASLKNDELQSKIPHEGIMDAIGTTQQKDAPGTNCRHWVHDTNKMVGALSATDYKQPKQILEDNKCHQLGYVGNSNSQGNRVYSQDGTSVSMVANAGGLGAKTGLYLENGVIRGRYNEEGKVEQRLELRNDGLTNTLTTVKKDNVIVKAFDIPKKINKFGKMENPYNIANEYFKDNKFTEPIALDEQNKCIRQDFFVGTLTTDGSSPKKNNRVVVAAEPNFRIRKLTPKECWRLQGFDDVDIDKCIELGISDSQLYKQAGNSITVNVLYHIFKNLFEKYIVKIN